MCVQKEGRHCPHCGKFFEPMTEKMWRNVLQVHLKCSVVHGFGAVLVPLAKKRVPDQGDLQEPSV